MKLYTVVGSPNCRRVHAVISHLGIQSEVEYLDFFEGDLQQPAYVAVNPNAKVPTLVDGDFSLWESNAIMQYLADGAGSEELFPRDPKLRADIVRWQFWELAHYNKWLGTLAFETVAKPGWNLGATNEVLVEVATGYLKRFAEVLEQHLAERRFMVADRVTLADYSVVQQDMFVKQVPFDWSPFPKLLAYYSRMGDNPHWAGTLPSDPSQIGRRPAAS